MWKLTGKLAFSKTKWKVIKFVIFKYISVHDFDKYYAVIQIFCEQNFYSKWGTYFKMLEIQVTLHYIVCKPPAFFLLRQKERQWFMVIKSIIASCVHETRIAYWWRPYQSWACGMVCLMEWILSTKPWWYYREFRSYLRIC